MQLYVLEVNRVDSKKESVYSGIVQYKGQTILINFCNDLKEKLNTRFKPQEINAVFITKQAGINNLKDFLEWKGKQEIPIYCESKLDKPIEYKTKDVVPYNSFKLSECIIMPFALPEKVGYRFENSLVWSGDFSEIPLESQRYFDHVDFVVSTEDSIPALSNKHIKKLYVLSDKKSTEEVLQEQKPALNIEYLQDEMSISLISAYLTESREGLSLTPAQSKYVWYGNKKLIVLEKEHLDKINKKLYLLGGNICYGFIILGSPRKITLSHFEELKDKHKITTAERQRWWGDKKVLFAYPFNFEKLSIPRKTEEEHKINSFVKTVTFLQDIESLKNPIDYNQNVPDDNQLFEDLEKVAKWYVLKQDGRKIKFTLEQIEDLGTKIYEEILRRNLGESYENVKVKAELPKSFFELISQKTYKGSQIELIQPKLSIQHCKSLEDVLEKLK